MSGNLKNTNLKVEGDILIKKDLLNWPQIIVDEDIVADDGEDGENVIVENGYIENGDVDVDNGGEDIVGDEKEVNEENNATVSTQRVIEIIGNLLNQEHKLIKDRYLALNNFCNELIDKGFTFTTKEGKVKNIIPLSKIRYFNQHLNNYYFQDQWTINEVQMLKDENYEGYEALKRRMKITILPSLKLFNQTFLFREEGEYISIMGFSLFREIFEVNLLPGIYVYDFKYSDESNIDKVIRFNYNGDFYHSDIKFYASKNVDFNPYTIYYIKRVDKINEDGEPYEWKCVVMLSGIDPKPVVEYGDGEDYERYELTDNQIYYQEYIVTRSGSDYDESKNYSQTVERARVFNDIRRNDGINDIKDMGTQQATKYWTVNKIVTQSELNEQVVTLEEYIKNTLTTGDILQYTCSSDDSSDGRDHFAYIFKLSSKKYLKYETRISADDTEPEIILEKVTIPPTIYSLTENQALKNQELINQK